MSCWPILGLDCCVFKGYYKCELLIAVAKDGNAMCDTIVNNMNETFNNVILNEGLNSNNDVGGH